MPRAASPERTAARQLGERYYSGADCTATHGSGGPVERYTSTGACVACVAGLKRLERARNREAANLVAAPDEFDSLFA